MHKQCPECGNLIKGRTDKKFCSDLCRNSCNNKRNSDSTNYMRSVNNSLRRNRRILMELTDRGSKRTRIHRERLYEKGFSFRHLTHILKTSKGDTYFFCYEYGYLPMQRDYYILVKSKEAGET